MDTEDLTIKEEGYASEKMGKKWLESRLVSPIRINADRASVMVVWDASEMNIVDSARN